MHPRAEDMRGEVTHLLDAARAGDASSLDRVFPIIYDELRLLARRQLRREAGPRTLQATALVHEAYLKLAPGGAHYAADRGHFLAIAARAMRQVLVDEARRRRAVKRGRSVVTITLSDTVGSPDVDADEFLALEEAIETLDARQKQVVELRFFAGMDEEETARLLGVSERTVRRDWVKARAWLYRSLYPDGPDKESEEGRQEGRPDERDRPNPVDIDPRDAQ